jgi:hypothetical protein
MKIRTSYPGQTKAVVEAPTHLFEQWFKGEVENKSFQPPFIEFMPTEDEITEVRMSKMRKLIGASPESQY